MPPPWRASTESVGGAVRSVDLAGDGCEREDASWKGCSPQAVKERSGKVQKASAYNGCVVVDLGVDDLEMSGILRKYSAAVLPYKEGKCHGKFFHRRR